MSSPKDKPTYNFEAFRVPPPPPVGDEWWSAPGPPGVSVTYDIVDETTGFIVAENVHPRVAQGRFLTLKANGQAVYLVRRTCEIER